MQIGFANAALRRVRTIRIVFSHAALRWVSTMRIAFADAALRCLLGRLVETVRHEMRRCAFHTSKHAGPSCLQLTPVTGICSQLHCLKEGAFWYQVSPLCMSTTYKTASLANITDSVSMHVLHVPVPPTLSPDAYKYASSPPSIGTGQPLLTCCTILRTAQRHHHRLPTDELPRDQTDRLSSTNVTMSPMRSQQEANIGKAEAIVPDQTLDEAIERDRAAVSQTLPNTKLDARKPVTESSTRRGLGKREREESKTIDVRGADHSDENELPPFNLLEEVRSHKSGSYHDIKTMGHDKADVCLLACLLWERGAEACAAREHEEEQEIVEMRIILLPNHYTNTERITSESKMPDRWRFRCPSLANSLKCFLLTAYM